MSEDSNSFGKPFMRYGTYDEARAWIGRTTGKISCEADVNWSQVKSFCAMVRDGNPSYWDEGWATRTHGSLLAPPATLMVWSMPLPWRPGNQPARGPIYAAEVPLPGDTLINVSTDTQFHLPIRVGDRLFVEDEVISVSPQKRTGLGMGHFVTTRATYWNQRDEKIATHENVLLRFATDLVPQASDDDASSNAAPASPAPDDSAGEDASAERLGPVTIPVTLALCVLDAAATRDLFPGHHDRDYARSQNARDVYLNTMFFHGLADRVALDWAGPKARIARRQLQMLSPVCVGDTLVATGRVVEHSRAPDSTSAKDSTEPTDRATVAVEMTTERGLGAGATVTVAFAPE